MVNRGLLCTNATRLGAIRKQRLLRLRSDGVDEMEYWKVPAY